MTKYTKEEQLDIGRRVFEHEFSYSTAAKEFDVSIPSVAVYVRKYKDSAGIEVNNRVYCSEEQTYTVKNIEALQKMTKSELIQEVIKAKIDEARAKKGYTVKGGGQNKEFVTLNEGNTK